MTAFYTNTVSDELTKSLDEMGMPIKSPEFSDGSLVVHNPTYAEVFDWLISKGYSVEILRSGTGDGWDAFMTVSPIRNFDGHFEQWIDAADTAIYDVIYMMED